MSEAIDRIERALKARYNIRELPEHLASALVAAKRGALAPLEALLEGRELYRWDAEVHDALAEVRGRFAPPPKPQAPLHEEPEPEPEAERDEPVALVEGSDESQKAGITSGSKPRKAGVKNGRRKERK